MKRLTVEICTFSLLIAITSSLTYYSSNYEYNQGYTNGHKDGYASGHKSGYDLGYSNGNKLGYNTGYAKGHSDGYASGSSDTQQTDNSNYISGYDQGQQDELADISNWINNTGCTHDSAGYVRFRMFLNYQNKLSYTCLVTDY